MRLYVCARVKSGIWTLSRTAEPQNRIRCSYFCTLQFLLARSWSDCLCDGRKDDAFGKHSEVRAVWPRCLSLPPYISALYILSSSVAVYPDHSRGRPWDRMPGTLGISQESCVNGYSLFVELGKPAAMVFCVFCLCRYVLLWVVYCRFRGFTVV